MAFLPTEGVEPIRGYQLVKRLGIGGFGEVWQATAPGGLTKAVKIIYGHTHDARAEQELRALNRIKEVRHPFLLSLERVEIIDDQVFIVTELAEASLMNRYEDCRKSGLPGIERQELLDYMRDAADALDYMNEHYGLQHLDIKPQNLLLVGGRIKIADFGLVKDLRGTSVTATGGVTPIYASPEAFDGKVSRYSDQYSLAIVYQEMLTGMRPFPGKTTLQLASQHVNSPPLLDPLPQADRPVIGRSLAKIPDQRFPTCREMVVRLNQATYVATTAPADAPSVASTAASVSTAPPPVFQPSSIDDLEDEGILNLDTIVSPDLVGKVVGKPVQALVLDQPEGVDEDRPSLTKAVLRPTLFIGVGGLAGFTLRRIKRRLHHYFKNLQAVPIYRMLLLDSDHAALRQAQTGADGSGLLTGETVHLPLHRPEHYRGKSRDLLQWLDRRWLLHGMPRSLLPEGMRPLGRLAYVDNASEVMARIHDNLALLDNPKAKSITTAHTGLDLRDHSPRIFLIASTSGGTGGGALVDVAFSVRQILKELHLHDDGICAILLHATGQQPAAIELARVNTYATLTELSHFCRLDTPYPGEHQCGLQAARNDERPFEEIYLINLGEDLDEKKADTSTDVVAEYLFLDAVTNAGQFFDHYRESTHSQAYGPEGDSALRSFGLYRLVFPRNVLAELINEQLCQHVVKAWHAGVDAREARRLKDEVVRQAIALGLETDNLCRRFHDTAKNLWHEDPESYFVKKLVQWSDGQTPSRNPAILGEYIRKVLDQAHELLGIGSAGQQGGKGPSQFETALAVQADEVAVQLGRSMAEWLVAVTEDPRGRINGAEGAASTLLRHLSTLNQNAEKQLKELCTDRQTLRQKLHAGDLSDKATASRWMALGRPGKANELQQRLLEYFWLRFKEIVLEQSLNVIGSVINRINKFSDDLDTVRQRLVQFSEKLRSNAGARGPSPKMPSGPDSIVLLPAQAHDVKDSAESLFRQLQSKLVLAFDQLLQAEIIGPQGGLWEIALKSRDVAGVLENNLNDLGKSAVLTCIKDLDAAKIFLEAYDDADQAKQALVTLVQAAEPRLSTSHGWQHLVVGLPRSKSGDALREMVGQAFPNVPTTVIPSDGDVILCWEAAQLPISQIASSLIGSENASDEVVRQIMTRIDVSWSPLVK